MARTGRPSFKVTAAMRRQVAELASCGMSQDDIARAIGCSTPTLVKHFGEELTTGAAKKRAEVIALLYRTARKGNVSAQRHLEAMTKVGAAAASVNQQAGAAPKEPKLGKKEERQQAAEQVTGVFAPPIGPRLAVNNT